MTTQRLLVQNALTGEWKCVGTVIGETKFHSVEMGLAALKGLGEAGFGDVFALETATDTNDSPKG